MNAEYDYIVVGQGLAGTCLTHALRLAGKQVLVFDDPAAPSSSRVAKGLFNPVTGRNMVLTWQAQRLFPYLLKFYRNLEQLLGTTFLHEMPVYRPFLSRQQQNDWAGRESDKRYSMFIDRIYLEPLWDELINNPLGGVMLKNSGYVDTNVLLDNYGAYLQEQGCLVRERFLPDIINFAQEKVVYKGYRAAKVVFCDGPAGVANKWLAAIKWRPVKGEVLEVETEADLDFIVNKKVFLMPRGKRYFAGSNYTWQDQSWQPTQAAREEISGHLQQLLKKPFSIVDQKAGIRPTVHDRRPVLGTLPHQPQIAVFSGLGTKGVSLAPYFANQLVAHLEKGAKIDPEADIGRFFD